ncbi:hypothetical protein GDO86_006083 [Hymenochirus boettgeri]|uniref:Golgin subfamily B member 1 n=1 Tax=Hymenochirus boettgeri TaxID=247094 RepID=A0A8T2J982_9PIPI|nr:hypothetical protein GDO86_006083 [Hymenochirus boettgeri]
MFSRLSGIANTVLHELSGDGEKESLHGATESVMESSYHGEISEDQMERLSHYEQLVVQLKELIQQKDVEIQKKDAQIKLEREASDTKLSKLKLQAKARVANLNKQLEDLKKAAPANQDSRHGSSDSWEVDRRNMEQVYEEEKKRMEDHVSELTKQLQESQDTVTKITGQLLDNQESLTELTRQLLESKENVKQLYDSLQTKEAETCELFAKLEEQSGTLTARTLFVERLEQELQNAELQKKVLSDQFRQTETELKSMRELLDAERTEHSCQLATSEENLKEKHIACERLLQELEKIKADIENSEKLRKEELQKSEEAQEKYKQMNEELSQCREVQNELNLLKEELKKGNNDELVELKAESSTKIQLIEATEEHEKLKIKKQSQIDQVNLGEEFAIEQVGLIVLGESVGQHAVNNMRQELEQMQEVSEELDGLKPEFEKMKGYQTEFEQGKNTKEELEKAKQELETVKTALIHVKRPEEKQERITEDTMNLEKDAEDVKHMVEGKERNNERDSDIEALNDLISQLQSQVQVLTSEKEALEKKNDFSDQQKQQMANYEAQNMLVEQIHSLENETRSKDLKITALQKDLDQQNLLLSEQETLSSLKEKQCYENEEHIKMLQEMLNLSQTKEERLSEALAANEREIVMLQNLLSCKTSDLEIVKCLVEEKDQQLAEISHSLSDKVVLLNEDKHSLGLEIKMLKEQLNIVNIEQTESSDAIKKENLEMHLQIEEFVKEKTQLQDKVAFFQKEQDKLHQQLVLTTSEHTQNQEMLRLVQEERGILQNQLEEQMSEHLRSQEMLSSLNGQKEEIQTQLYALRNEYAEQQRIQVEMQEQIQNLSVKQMDNSDTTDITQLQKDKRGLENELQTLKSRTLHEIYVEGSKGKEEQLQEQLEQQKKELDQLKKKLQAALINRKELMKKVSTLEKELVKNTEWDSSIEGATSVFQQVPDQALSEENLKQQLSGTMSAMSMLAEKSTIEERLQTLIKEMTLELREKDALIETMNLEKTENLFLIERLTSESCTKNITNLPPLDPEEQMDTRAKMEDKIANLEQDKENLQRKVQEALTSRRDTIKKAQEKDRHHREQLKLQKEELSILQQKYEELGKSNLMLQEQIQFQQEKDIGKLHACPLKEPQNAETQTEVSSDYNASFLHSEKNTECTSWGNDLVEFSKVESKDTGTEKFTEETIKCLELQLLIFEKERDEFKLRAVGLEKELSLQLEEFSHLQDTLKEMTRQLELEKENRKDSEVKAASLKTELDKKEHDLYTMQSLKSDIKKAEANLNFKEEELKKLEIELEERNEIIRSMQVSLLGKEDLINALKAQVESQAEEKEEHMMKLEKQVQNKQEEDVEEAKNKTQLQRKLQAALISRKEALKESKTLQKELETMRKQQEDLSKQLKMAEDLISHLNKERDEMLENLLSQKENQDKLITEIDKRLMENQNLEAACESLKLVLHDITHDKEILEKQLESMKNLENSQQLEWQDKLNEQKKEYELLLQSYENVSNETDRMNRALEAVRQEKQEVFIKMKSMESAKKELEKQVEEVEQELENMKEKMRKFAKSKQQKILDLEEENERLRGELQPTRNDQNLQFDKPHPEIKNLKDELERVCSEKQSLVVQFEVVRTENSSLLEEIKCLKLQLQNVDAKLQKTAESVNEVITTQDSFGLLVSQSEKTEALEENSQLSLDIVQKQEEKSQQDYLISQLKDHITELEVNEKTKEQEIHRLTENLKLLQGEKYKAEIQVSELQENISKLKKESREMEELCKKKQIDLTKAIKQIERVELDKDELEERLMNQLAELNGSIGNYQQDAIDLQIKNDFLQKELQDIKLQLEEEKRQLERQKAEELSVVQKEYVEKLKSIHQGEKGKKSQAKELQELLKEKQQEVRHLQKDCIQFQENISSLERTIKALELVHSECENEKVTAKEKLAKANEKTKNAKDELISLRVLLEDTQSEATKLLAEGMHLKEEVRAVRADTVLKLNKKDEEMEKKIQQEREKHQKEIRNMQEKQNLLLQEKEQLENTINNLQTSLDKKTLELKELRGNLNENIVKLAAFTRSMCSLQDDRDRIVDESKKWNEKFSDAMQAKDNEIHEKENVCKSLKSELTDVKSQAEKLQVQVNRLELLKQELMATIEKETESHLSIQNSLLEEKAVLSSRLEKEQCLQHQCQEELRIQKQKATDKQNQSEDMEKELKEFRAERAKQLETIRSLELEIQDIRLHSEQIQSDLQASKILTDQLHHELEQKEQDVVRLLSSQDEAVSTAVWELQDLHIAQIKSIEKSLADMELSNKNLQEKMESSKAQMLHSQEEARSSKSQLEAMAKSMCSLQEERERVLNDYQQLEQKHLDAMLAKDSLIQEAAAESNKLREELRFLLSRTDDLNAQNAKLNAQLSQYREDLKELITLKDSQLKQIIKEKLQEIERLQLELNALKLQFKQERQQVEILQQNLEETKKEKQSRELEFETLTACVSKQQHEMAEGEVQYALETAEVKRLKEELELLQGKYLLIKDEKSQIKAEAEKRVRHAEEELQRKMYSLEHDTGVMRNEAETAEERVAELARDLLKAEQLLLDAREENTALKTQLQAFEGSMRSLQDSHDFAQEELKRMQEQYKKLSLLQEEMASQNTTEQQILEEKIKEQAARLHSAEEVVRQLTSDLEASKKQIGILEIVQEEYTRLQGSMSTPQRQIEMHVQSTDLRDKKLFKDHSSDSLFAALHSSQEEVQSLHSQLSDALSQVHHKELKIQQLSGKLSQIFDEKNALSLQLRGCTQNLRDALGRYASLEKQMQDMGPKNQVQQEALLVDSAPGAPQERKEPNTEGEQQLVELQQRYQKLEQRNFEAEQLRTELEQQLIEERQRTEDRFQEIENRQRLHSNIWSAPEDPNMSQELSLLIEPQETVNRKARSSSVRRFLRRGLFFRTRTPLLAGLYLLIIHVLLLLCVTGHL